MSEAHGGELVSDTGFGRHHPYFQPGAFRSIVPSETATSRMLRADLVMHSA